MTGSVVRLNPDREAGVTPLIQQPVGLGAGMAAAAGQSIRDAPVSALSRMAEIEEARGFNLDDPFSEYTPSSRILSIAEANERGKDYGLQFDREEPEEVVEILIRRKREERLRQSIRDRAPKGFGAQAALVATDLAAQIADPLNVASAFIPVVREARFAQLVGRFGKTGARAITGAVEGTVGGALVEPVVYLANRQQQADYTMTDALLNVAFGTVIGSGLHVGGGALADMVRRTGIDPPGPTTQEALSNIAPERRDAAMRTAVAQMATDRRVDVDGVLGAGQTPRVGDEFTEAIDAAEVQGTPLARAKPGSEFVLGELTRSRYRDYSGIRNADRKYIEGVVAEVQQAQAGQRIFREGEVGGDVAVTGLESTFPNFVTRANVAAANAKKARARIQRENAKLPDDRKQALPAVPPTLTKENIERTAVKLLAGEPLGKAEGSIAVEIMAEAKARRAQDIEDMTQFRADREADNRAYLDSLVEREGLPERNDLADMEAAETPVPVEKSDLTIEAQDAMDDALEQMRLDRDALEGDDILRLLDEDEAELVRLLSEVTEVEVFDRMADAAVVCGLRRG